MQELLYFLGVVVVLVAPFFAFYKMYKRIIECKKRKLYAYIVSFVFSVPTIMAALSTLLLIVPEQSIENSNSVYTNLVFAVVPVGLYFFIYFLHSKKEYIVCVDSHEAGPIPPLIEEEPSKRKKILIGYNDEYNNLTIREIDVIAVYTDRFDAYCYLRKAKRTFLIDGVLSSITDVQSCLSIDKWKWFESIGGHRPSSVGASTTSNDMRVVDDEINSLPDTQNDPCIENSLASDKPSLAGSEILFTGFKSDMRLCLEDAARACGMVVRTKVTKNLSYLVCGPKDAPAKRLEAINMGASVVYGTDGFRSLLVK